MTTKNPDFFRGRTEMTSVSTEKPENPKRQLKYLKFTHGPIGMKIGKNLKSQLKQLVGKLKNRGQLKKFVGQLKKPCLAPCWCHVETVLGLFIEVPKFSKLLSPVSTKKLNSTHFHSTDGLLLTMHHQSNSSSNLEQAKNFKTVEKVLF